MVFTIEEALERSKETEKGVSFDEALKRTKFGKFQHFLIFISGVVMSTTFFETMSVNLALPVAECDLHITSKQQYGIISGMWFAGIILTSHLWGFLSDTYGRRKILIIASLLAFCGSVLSSLAINFWQLAFFRLLNGLCISGSSSVIFAYLGEFLGSKTRSRSMMFSSVIFGVVCLILPFIAWIIINQTWSFDIPLIQVTYKPWRLFLVACGLPSLLCGVTIIFCPESPKFTFSQGDEAETLKIFRRIYYLNSGSWDYNVHKIIPNDEFEQTHKKENVARMMFNQSVTLIRDYPRSICIVSMLQFGVYFVCNGMLLFFPDILNQTARHMETSSASKAELCEIVESAIATKKHQYEAAVATCVDELDISTYYYSIVLEVCYVVGFLVISLLVNYIGRLTILTVVFFSTGLCGILIVLVSNPVYATYLYVWLLACGVNNTLLHTVTYELFPTNLRSLALSLSLMMGRLGSLVGGNIAGLLLEAHCSSMFVLSGAVLVVSGCLTFVIPNIMKKK